MSTLRFLLLEDKPLDAEAIQDMLTNGGVDYELLRVGTHVDFVTALETNEFDLILAAYAVPDFDSIAALETARNLHSEIPFIFVSASLGEELAVETLKRGATDYVLKQRLGRLVPCVQRALREAQERRDRQRAEAALRESEAIYRTLFESIDEGFCICEMLFDKNGEPADYRFLKVNSVFERLTGLKQATGKTARELVPNLEADWFKIYGRVVRTGEGVRFENQSIVLDRWFDVNAFCIGEPRSNQFAILFTNISERKKFEQERKRAEQALRESEEQSRNILESITDAFFAVGENWQFTYVNQTAGMLVNCPPSDLIGKIFWEEFPGVNDSEFEQMHRRVMRDRVAESLTEFYPDHNRWYEVRSYPAADGITIYFRNVTEQIQAKESLRQSESRFRLMVESAKEYAIFTLDLNGIVTGWNAGAERLLRYQEAEIINCDGRILFTPEDNERGQAEREMQIALTQGQAENERWHLRKDGSRFWASGLMMPLLDEGENVQGFVKIMQDKTAQRQANERLHLLYDTTSDLLATEQPLTLVHNLFRKLSAPLDLHYYCNYIVEEKDDYSILHLKNYEGLSEAEAQSLEWLELGQHLCGQVAQERQQIVLNQAQIISHPNAHLIRSLGITAYVGQPLIVQGRLLGTLSFASRTRTSFTPEEIDLLQSTCDQMAIALERANLLTSIQQQAEQLQQANRIKDEFLAVLSHELRSPLNPILGWTQLLRNGKLDVARQAEALATIERNARLQSQLIEDLLDISRIMQGKLSLTVAPVSLTFVISAAVETVRLAAEVKNIELQLDIDPVGATISGDAARLQQVVWNLLTNAVKFTPSGGRVAVELRQINQLAQIRVIDTGKGINPPFLPYVFEYFRQEDGSTTRKFGGLGLGLAIVRQIVEMHGGTVKVESHGENQGATFIVQLPVVQQAATTISVPTRPQVDIEAPLHNIQILLVDDDVDTREFQAFLLEQNGAEVTAVASGLEALQVLDRFIPDVLVSDVGMAEMDGYMLMRKIRSLPPAQGGAIRAIALTAYAAELDQQRAIQAGFQLHMTKPVEPEILVSGIANLPKHNRY